MTTTTSTISLKNKLSSTTGMNHQYHMNSLNIEHFIDERYPKTCLKQIPPIMREYPLSKLNNQPSRSRHSLRFRIQPVSLTEIYETDEENKIENNNQQQSQTKIFSDNHPLEHLTLPENIQQMTKKKAPLKNFLERQRLKTTREELCETDDN